MAPPSRDSRHAAAQRTRHVGPPKRKPKPLPGARRPFVDGRLTEPAPASPRKIPRPRSVTTSSADHPRGVTSNQPTGRRPPMHCRYIFICHHLFSAKSENDTENQSPNRFLVVSRIQDDKRHFCTRSSECPPGVSTGDHTRLPAEHTTADLLYNGDLTCISSHFLHRSGSAGETRHPHASHPDDDSVESGVSIRGRRRMPAIHAKRCFPPPPPFAQNRQDARRAPAGCGDRRE